MNEENESENIITYETFRKFHRREKNNEKLQELPREFYNSCKKWISRKREEFEKSKGDTTSLYELENVKKIIRDIFDRRERKIILMALHTVRSGISPENLLPEERDFFDETVSILQKFRNGLLKRVTESEEEVEEKVESEIKRKSEQKEKPKKEEKVVRMLENTPQFLGENEEKYGPFKKEDLVTLPEKIADLLVKKGKAEEVEV